MWTWAKGKNCKKKTFYSLTSLFDYILYRVSCIVYRDVCICLFWFILFVFFCAFCFVSSVFPVQQTQNKMKITNYWTANIEKSECGIWDRQTSLLSTKSERKKFRKQRKTTNYHAISKQLSHQFPLLFPVPSCRSRYTPLIIFIQFWASLLRVDIRPQNK